MKSKLGRFLDNTSIYFLSTVITFILLKSFIKSNFTTLILCLILSFFILKIAIYFQNINLKKLSIKNSEKQNIIDYNIALRKMSETSQLTFFKNLLKSKSTIKTPHGLIIENKILLSLQLSKDSINPENIFTIYSKAKNMKKHKIEEICIVCNKVSEEAKNILNNFDLKITLFTPTETYALMKKNNFYPQLSEIKQKIKPKFFKEAFMKNKGKQFIKCSFFLYILSIIIPFTKYYLISASILLIIGLICLIFGKNKVVVEPLSKQILLS